MRQFAALLSSAKVPGTHVMMSNSRLNGTIKCAWKLPCAAKQEQHLATGVWLTKPYDHKYR
jgi:hypothetical protein